LLKGSRRRGFKSEVGELSLTSILIQLFVPGSEHVPDTILGSEVFPV